MSWRYVKAARDHRIWPTLVNWRVTSIKTSEAMQPQTVPKETFIIVIFGGMIRRYDSGYGSGYDSWVWFAELELPTLTKICTPEKKHSHIYCIKKIKRSILDRVFSLLTSVPPVDTHNFHENVCSCCSFCCCCCCWLLLLLLLWIEHD